MMISSFQNATKALEHVAAAQAAQRGAPIPAPRASHESATPRGASPGPDPAVAAYAPSARTVTVTVTMTVHDGGQVDLVL